MDLSLIHIFFDPYFTEGKGNGHMGLGLAYCRNVIKAHGGYIQVKTQCGRAVSYTHLLSGEKRALRFPFH